MLCIYALVWEWWNSDHLPNQSMVHLNIGQLCSDYCYSLRSNFHLIDVTIDFSLLRVPHSLVLNIPVFSTWILIKIACDRRSFHGCFQPFSFGLAYSIFSPATFSFIILNVPWHNGQKVSTCVAWCAGALVIASGGGGAFQPVNNTFSRALFGRDKSLV